MFARYANELAKEGKIDEALEVLNAGINANPFYAPGYSVLANINKTQNLHEAAAEHYEKALGLDPQSPGDLMALGEYKKVSDPEKARKIFLRAGCFEPDVTDIQAVISKIDAPEKEMSAPEDEMSALEDEIDLELSSATENALTELTESHETVEDHDDIDDNFAELLADTPQPVPEGTDLPEISDSSLAETEMNIPEDIPDDIPDMAPAEELTAISEEIIAEETEEIVLAEESLQVEEMPDETVEDADGSTDEADDIAALFGDREDPAYVDEGLMPPVENATDIDHMQPDDQVDVDEDVEQSIISGDTPDEDSIGETAPVEEESLAELELPESEKTASMDEIDDLSSLYGVQTLENGAALEELPGQLEEIDSVVDVNIADDIDADAIPAYADILESSNDVVNGQEDDSQELGVVDIDDTGEDSYGTPTIEYDLGTEMEEPVISEQERAELMSFDQEPESSDSGPGLDEEEKSSEGSTPDTGATDDSGTELDEPSVEGKDTALYGDLSSDELEILSTTDTEQVGEGVDLDDEIKEGIDYSDILYGHEEMSETESPAVSDSVSPEVTPDEQDVTESIQPEESVESTDIPATEDLNMMKQSLDIDDSDYVGSASTIDLEINDFADTYSDGGLVQDIHPPQAEETGSEETEAYDLSLDEKDVVEVEHTSLEDLINNYVGALQDSDGEEEPEQLSPVEDVTHTADVEIDFTGGIGMQGLSGEIKENTQMTVTMAEIYVKQGLISSAIDIYQNLQSDAPHDEKIASRLEELQKIKNEESDAV